MTSRLGSSGDWQRKRNKEIKSIADDKPAGSVSGNKEAFVGQAHRFVFAKQSSKGPGKEYQEPTQDLGRLEFKRGAEPRWGWTMQPRPTGLARRKVAAA